MARPPSKSFSPPDLEALKAEAQAAVPGRKEMPPLATSTVGAVLARHRKRLMAIRGVNMTGEGQDRIGRPAIVVGVEDAKFLAGVPASVEGIPIVKQVLGKITASRA